MSPFLIKNICVVYSPKNHCINVFFQHSYMLICVKNIVDFEQYTITRTKKRISCVDLIQGCVERVKDCSSDCFFFVLQEDMSRRRLPEVFHAEFCLKSDTAIILYFEIFSFSSWRKDVASLYPKVRSYLRLADLTGDSISLSREPQRIKEGKGADYRDAGLNPCRYYLPFSGCSARLSSISSLTLGGQIVGLMLLGFAFAIPSCLGVFRAFDDSNREGLSRSLALSAVCTPVWLFLYCWAFWGHPFWGHPMRILGVR